MKCIVCKKMRDRYSKYEMCTNCQRRSITTLIRDGTITLKNLKEIINAPYIVNTNMKRRLYKFEHIETEAIPIELEFKRKDGSIQKIKAKKIVRKRIASKKALRAYFKPNKNNG